MVSSTPIWEHNIGKGFERRKKIQFKHFLTYFIYSVDFYQDDRPILTKGKSGTERIVRSNKTRLRAQIIFFNRTVNATKSERDFSPHKIRSRKPSRLEIARLKPALISLRESWCVNPARSGESQIRKSK